MTTSSSSRPPLPTLATKSPSTSQSSRLNAVASDKNTSVPRASSRVPRNSTPRQDGTVQDPTSERATLSLIRRALVADGTQGTETRASSPSPIEGILPPLTSSNEIDVQLYAIVAIVIKDFVNSWYSKITPDHVFVDEVIQIIAHCSRAFEQRIRQLDIPELVLDELPVLVERHIEGMSGMTRKCRCSMLTESPHSIQNGYNGSGCLAVRRRPSTNLPLAESTPSPRSFSSSERTTRLRIRLPTIARPRGSRRAPTHRRPGERMSQNTGDRHHR